MVFRRNASFDYDFVFYDNIHYFLQEYEAWEKTFTSELWVLLNEFDNENYLQFLAGGNGAPNLEVLKILILERSLTIYFGITQAIYGVGRH